MRLWFDEDLSPTLVQVANGRGFEATCNRDRGLLGATDAASAAAGESPADFMVNRFVELDDDGRATARELPPA